MSASNILRALSIALLLILIIIDSLYGVIIKLVLVIVIAALFYLSFHVENNKQNHDAESILVVVFFISLVGLFLVFSSSPTHIIVEPDAINETFTFPNDIGGSNKMISIKNLGSNEVGLSFSADGNNIKDNNDIRSSANQLSISIKIISDSASTLGKSEIDAKSDNSVDNGSKTPILKIERERTEYVSVEIDPSMAPGNGEYKGAIIIETDDKKLRKEVPISIKIKGITSGSAESNAEEDESDTFKNITLDLTGSLGFK